MGKIMGAFPSVRICILRIRSFLLIDLFNVLTSVCARTQIVDVRQKMLDSCKIYP